jgi:Acyl-CoA dehydrogenase, C-terminal domain
VIDGHERDLFERGVRAALEDHTSSGLVAALSDLGWYDALRADARVAISVLFDLYGELNASSSLDGVLASVLSPGEPMAVVALPIFGSLEPPGQRRGDTLVVHGMVSDTVQSAERAVIAARSVDRTEIHTVTTAELHLRRIAGIDPALGWFELSGTADVGSEQCDDSGEVWESSVALGQLALSHELIGTSRSMLRLATDHATERIQFGVAISTFQAVRHRLSDGLVAIAAAEAAVDAAWELGSPFAASVAKAVAGKTARMVARHSQQILAGIGFTAEHPLHRLVKRTLTLDQTLGGSNAVTRSIGEELLRSRELPVALPL